MVNVVGVRFKSAGKVYFFDPSGFILEEGDSVIVETARGMEFGVISSGPRNVKEKDIVKPLKKVVRIANEKDIARNNENLRKRDEAMSICQGKIEKHHLEMKLVDVEYTFDNNKIIFYFTADGRVDFRELVKDLASVFRMRIELRQIGVRDEAKMLGGVGCCGRGLCCHEWMNDFHPVSIKMAKTQNLSLNPVKISGICGRLMCCLKYENDVYTELKKGMPQMNDRIRIKEGVAVVTEANILEQRIKCRLVEEEADKENGFPEKLSQEVYTVEKGEFKKLDKGRNKNRKKQKEEEELTDELKELLKD
jgi:cell fate regulator YaaT (PSP1 superfamily)